MAKIKSDAGFSTRAIHAGQEPAPGNGAIMTPIYATSTYVQESPGVHSGYEYSRTDNPTRHALEDNVAALEGAKHGVAFASGCSAADTTLRMLSAGDHVISSDDVYGGCFRLFEKVFRPAGIDFSYVDLSNPDLLEGAIQKNTKLIWIETPTNPLLKLIDIEKVSEVAKKKGILVVVDNTFASPYLQTPLSLGADISLHSSTKYIGGHSDVVGGILLTNDDELNEKLRFLQNGVGAVPSPFDCYLLLRSTKTLAVRMEKHSENAVKIAEFLESRDDVSKVIYPGLASHPQHDLCKKQMRLGGGMLSVELTGGLDRSRKFLEQVEVFSLAESLGGVESLIEHPAIMTHASIPAETRISLGITDGLVRLSVGIEDADDLLLDLAHALDSSS